MVETTTPPSPDIRLLYAMLADPTFSFNYFNRGEHASVKKGGKSWSIMRPQSDYLYALTITDRLCISSGRNAGKCFHHATFLTMEDGSIIVAKDLPLKFKIQTYNETTNTIYWTDAFKSENGIADCYELKLQDGKTQIVSREHPYLTVDGWMPINKLRRYNFILQPVIISGCIKLTPMYITDVQYVGMHDTIAITVPETRTHIINGILSHNTSSIESAITSFAITHPRKWTGYMVRNKRHANVLEQHLIAYFNKNPLLTQFFINYDKKDRIFHFTNGHKVEIRIAGIDKTGATTAISWHPDFIIVDEAQLLPSVILKELLPALNEGGKIIYAGVPNDIRDTILYRGCSDDSFTYIRYASYESENWDESKRDLLLKEYGGAESPSWRSLVDGCFTAGQKILTFNGLVNIEDIKLDDKVLTHKGNWRKVTQLHNFNYKGDVYKIKTAYDCNVMTVTPEHPILSILFRATHRGFKISDLDFRRPSTLRVNDKIKFAEVQNSETLTEQTFGLTCRRKPVIHTEKFTPEFCYALGLYLAEGWGDKYKMVYSLHQKETYLVEKLRKYFTVPPVIKHSKSDKSMLVSFYNVIQGQIFQTLITPLARAKKFNFDIFSLPTSCKIELIRGVMDGDGCRRIRNYKGKTSVEYALGLSSENAIYQIRLLLRQLGINCAVTEVNPTGNSFINGRKIKSGKSWRLDIYGYFACELDKLFGITTKNMYINKPHFVSDFKLFSTIISLKCEKFDGKVYNFAVEDDESYIVSDKAVHNCWGESAMSVFRPSKLVDNSRDITTYRYKSYSGQLFDSLLPQLNLPPIAKKYDYYVLGGDMGYTANSPANIMVLGGFKDKDVTNPDGKVDHYDIVFRLELTGMTSYNLAKTIDYLMGYLNTKYVAFDAQNMGYQVYSDLCNKEIFPMTHLRNKTYIYPVMFASPVSKGFIEEYDPKEQKTVRKEVIVAAKCASTDKLVELLEADRLHLPIDDSQNEECDDMITILQAEAATQTLNRMHPKVYTNSVNTHLVDALRCTAISIHLFVEGRMHSQYVHGVVKPARLTTTPFSGRSSRLNLQRRLGHGR